MRQFLLLTLTLAAAAVLALVGLRWGLPSDERRELLMARPPAPGMQKLMKETRDEIYSLSGGSALGRLAGTGAHFASPAAKSLGIEKGWLPYPLTPRLQAGFFRPYFLRTNSTDEQMTVAALAGMRPASYDFNPRIAQYGGLYIYGMGAFFAAAEAAGLITVDRDITFYFRSPGEMGEIFAAGRALNALWLLLAVFFVYAAGSKLFSPAAGLIAAAALALCPGMIFQAHFMKPYLMGCAAAGAALYFSVAGWHLMGAVAAGLAAAAMPLYAPIALVPAAALLVSGKVRPSSIMLVILLPAAVFFACNPYWAVNFREMAGEIMSTRSAYAAGLQPDVFKFFFLKQLPVSFSSGLSVLLGLGVIAVLLLPGRRTFPLLLGGLAPLVFFAVLMQNQPATVHLSRFLLPWYMALVLPGAHLASLALQNRLTRPLAAVIIAALLGHGAIISAAYAVNFARDASADSTRLAAAAWIKQNLPEGTEIGIVTLPEPAFVPPMDFARYRMEYLDATAPPRAGYLVVRRDYLSALHASWQAHYVVLKEFRPVRIAGSIGISDAHVNTGFVILRARGARKTAGR